MSLQQQERVAQLETPLGTDRLALTSFDGSERISDNFEFVVEAVSEEANLSFDSALGQNCTVTLTLTEAGERHFDGILTEARWTGTAGKLHYYRLVLRPWLWLLSLRTNCLIFHEKKAPDIIKEVFGKYGFAEQRDALSRDYPTLEYCVQYRESDMDFVRRLMEQHGITFWFEHEKGKHTLVLSDKTSSYKAVGSRPYIHVDRPFRAEKEHFFSVRPERRFTSGAVVLDDYNFKTPDTDLAAERVSGDAGYDNSPFEIFDYPGKHKDRSEGETYAQARLDLVRAADRHVEAEGDCASCFPGALVTLEEHDQGALNTEYLVLGSRHTFAHGAYRSGDIRSEPYRGRYELARADEPYAAPLRTPKPFIRGPQTAKVICDNGHDVDIDEYNRITVRFFWDRKEDLSMRCRVAQVWASDHWGGVFVPRKDMEVLVEFLDGDPDRPLVVGAVYNENNMPPSDDSPSGDYEWKHIYDSGIKTKTVDGSGYNELMFRDEPDAQLVRVHAEKDLSVEVVNDEKRLVLHDRSSEIRGSDKLLVHDTLSIEAFKKIELKVGASKITMTTEKIAVEALTLEITATEFKSTAVSSQHSAAAVMDIKGLLVKINS